MTLEEAKAYVLKRARELGVEAELLFEEERELSLRAREGRLEEIKEARQRGLGLRVVAEGKVGYAYTEELSPEALDWALEEARANALLPAKEGALPQGSPLGSHDLLGEGKKEAALALEAALRQDPRVKSVLMGGYLEREIRVALKSTQGAEGSFRTGFAALTGSFVMAQGKSVKQGWDFKAGKEFHALEPGRTALEFREKTARLLEAKPLKTGRYRAYLEPRAMAMLLSVFAEALSGKNALEGKSRLLGRLGERIASPLVTLVDDPTLEKGLLSRPLDAYRGTLGVAPTNLYLEPVGNLALTDGVVVTEFMGLHAGANPVTLDFSLQALGLWVEEGEVRHAVENFAVSGNLLELLQAVEAVGDDLDWLLWNAAYGSPTVAVAELSFAGA